MSTYLIFSERRSTSTKIENSPSYSIFKKGDVSEISNYRPKTALSCVSKILERIMYNRVLFGDLINYDLLHKKELDFQRDHSASQAIL